MPYDSPQYHVRERLMLGADWQDSRKSGSASPLKRLRFTQPVVIKGLGVKWASGASAKNGTAYHVGFNVDGVQRKTWQINAAGKATAGAIHTATANFAISAGSNLGIDANSIISSGNGLVDFWVEYVRQFDSTWENQMDK